MDRSGISRRIERIYQKWQQNQLEKVILHSHLFGHMIAFTEACQYYLSSVTFRVRIFPCADASTARPSCSDGLKITGMIVIIGVMNILEAQLQTPNSRRARSLRVQCSGLRDPLSVLLEFL